MAYVSRINEIVDRVRDVIATVAGIASAQVHDGERDLQSLATWQALGWDAANKRPSGWYVDVESSDWVGDMESSTMHLRQREHHLVIVGWLAVDDPQTGTSATSAATWRQRVEDVSTAIREDLAADPSLLGFAQGGTPPETRVSEHGEVRDVLCHYVELEMTAIERIAWS